MSATTHDDHVRRILDAVAVGRDVSQRTLARELGVALGLANLLVKRLVREGWVRLVPAGSVRVRYVITPAGLAERTRMSRAYLEHSVEFYRQTRDRIQRELAELSTSWPVNGHPSAKRIVFYGAGEVAEIGYVCLPETDLQLVGVVDPCRTKPFFGMDVSSPAHVDGLRLNGQPFDRLVVMSFGNRDSLLADVGALPVPPERVHWL